MLGVSFISFLENSFFGGEKLYLCKRYDDIIFFDMIERKTLAHQMASDQRKQISSGKYIPGDKLPVEAELAIR